MRPDHTWLAVRRQLTAMDCGGYEIGIRDAGGRMLRRTWSVPEVLKAVPWLKQQNASGADIYAQPAGEQNPGLVLVDDLTLGGLDRMKANSLAPAAVIETSPQNYQAWVRLSEQPLTREIATAAAQLLAKRYGGDPNSAGWRHFGRLAGFTNRKPHHKGENGYSPFVKLHVANREQAPAGVAFLQELTAKQEIAMRRSITPHKARHSGCAARVFADTITAITARYGANTDYSKADIMVCRDLARQGFSVDEIVEAILQCSPNLDTRKAGHQQDYAERTARAAFQAASAALSPTAPAGGAV